MFAVGVLPNGTYGVIQPTPEEIMFQQQQMLNEQSFVAVDMLAAATADQLAVAKVVRVSGFKAAEAIKTAKGRKAKAVPPPTAADPNSKQSRKTAFHTALGMGTHAEIVETAAAYVAVGGKLGKEGREQVAAAEAVLAAKAKLAAAAVADGEG